MSSNIKLKNNLDTELSIEHSDNEGAFGSNIFKWNDSSIDEPNGGTIIKLDSVETGRYELQYREDSLNDTCIS